MTRRSREVKVIYRQSLRSRSRAPVRARTGSGYGEGRGKCRPVMPIDPTARGQADILFKLPRRSGPPLAPGKTCAPGSSLAKIAKCSRSAGMIAARRRSAVRPVISAARGAFPRSTARRKLRAPGLCPPAGRDRIAEHALRVKPCTEPGHVQPLVLVSDGVKGLVPGWRHLARCPGRGRCEHAHPIPAGIRRRTWRFRWRATRPGGRSRR